MNTWVTSDTHYDHMRIIEYENRPFDSPTAMTEALINNWNNVVAPDDLVFHLGDVFFCKTDRMNDISQRLNGRKVLIRGNHDGGVSDTKFRRLGFEVYNYYFIDGYVLSHYPQGETALRVAIYKGLLRGNIHGHVHSQIDGLDQSIYRCVSVELTDYEPIKLKDISFPPLTFVGK